MRIHASSRGAAHCLEGGARGSRASICIFIRFGHGNGLTRLRITPNSLLLGGTFVTRLGR